MDDKSLHINESYTAKIQTYIIITVIMLFYANCTSGVAKRTYVADL